MSSNAIATPAATSSVPIGDHAIVLHAGDWLRVRPLPPGLHVLTAHDVNDASDRRIGHSLWWLSQRNYANGSACVAALQELCAQRGNADPPICVHGKEGGTVSSSIVMLSSLPAHSLYLHRAGTARYHSVHGLFAVTAANASERQASLRAGFGTQVVVRPPAKHWRGVG